jgi:hypothetical protein
LPLGFGHRNAEPQADRAADICREHAVIEAAFYICKKNYSGPV